MATRTPTKTTNATIENIKSICLIFYNDYGGIIKNEFVKESNKKVSNTNLLDKKNKNHIM